MLEANTINKIIKDTIGAIESTSEKTRSDEQLVIATFLMETDMEWMFDGRVPIRHGLMGIDFNSFKSFVHNKLIVNKPLVNDFRNICLVDVETDSIEDLFDAALYNIAFQVLFVWAYYRINLSEMPRSIETVAAAYCYCWDNDNNVDEKDVLKYIVDWSNGEV